MNATTMYDIFSEKDDIITLKEKKPLFKPAPKNAPFTPLSDYYLQPLNIGDIVLGARLKGKYGEPEFVHSVIIGRTAHQLRVHQIQNITSRGFSKEFVLSSIESRPHPGGLVTPQCTIRIYQGFLTLTEITTAYNKGTAEEITPELLPTLIVFP